MAYLKETSFGAQSLESNDSVFQESTDNDNFEYFGSIMNSIIASSSGQDLKDSTRFGAMAFPEHAVSRDMNGKGEFPATVKEWAQDSISQTHSQFQAVATLTFARQGDGKAGYLTLSEASNSPRPSESPESAVPKQLLKILTCTALFQPPSVGHAQRGKPPALASTAPPAHNQQPGGAQHRYGSRPSPNDPPDLYASRTSPPSNDGGPGPTAPGRSDPWPPASGPGPDGAPAGGAAEVERLRAELARVRARRQDVIGQAQRLQVAPPPPPSPPSSSVAAPAFPLPSLHCGSLLAAPRRACVRACARARARARGCA